MHAADLGAGARQLAVDDLDGDGHPDVVAAAPGGAVLIYYGRGGGSFAPAVGIGLGGDVWGVAVADLDNNGSPDIVASLLAAGSVAVVLNDGARSFTPAATYSAYNGPSTLAVAALTHDSTVPSVVALGEMYDALTVLPSTGDGRLAPAVTYSAGLIPHSFVLTDIDGDHLPDLAYTGALHGTVTLGRCPQ